MASYQPEVYFGQDWHGSGNRFATRQEAESFVANLAETWNPKGFIRDTRVVWVEEPVNAVLDRETKQADKIVVPEEVELTSAQKAVIVEEDLRKQEVRVAQLREVVWQREKAVQEASAVWDQTNLVVDRQKYPLTTAQKLLDVAKKEFRREEARLLAGERAVRGTTFSYSLPPSLQQLVLDYGTHDKITPEAWAGFGADMAEWKAKIRAGEQGDENFFLSEVNNRRTYSR